MSKERYEGAHGERRSRARRRPVLIFLLLAWLSAIVALTLFPARITPPLTLETFLCVGCGSRGTADIISNWLVFLPGGVLMALIFGGGRAVFLAVCLTVVVETLQIGIPGRDPALQDLLANSLGALSGVLLLHRGLGLGGRRALALLAAVAWVAPVALLIPMTSSADLYGQWTPVFGDVETYRGRILDASLGGRPVRSGILADRAPLDAAIVHRDAVELRLVAGPPPTSFAPIFQIVDRDQVTLVMVGAVGEDLIFRVDDPARLLRFDQPGARWRGAMAGVAVDDTVSVVVDRSRDAVCMTVARRSACHLEPSLADGWGLLDKLESAPRWLGVLASLAWTIGLGGLLGITAPDLRTAAMRGAALAVFGLVASYLSPDVRADAVHAGVLAAAAMLGGRLGPSLRHLRTRLTSS